MTKKKKRSGGATPKVSAPVKAVEAKVEEAVEKEIVIKEVKAPKVEKVAAKKRSPIVQKFIY